MVVYFFLLLSRRWPLSKVTYHTHTWMALACRNMDTEGHQTSYLATPAEHDLTNSP